MFSDHQKMMMMMVKIMYQASTKSFVCNTSHLNNTTSVLQMCLSIRWSIRASVTWCAGSWPVCSQIHLLLFPYSDLHHKGLPFRVFRWQPMSKFSLWNILEGIGGWEGVVRVSPHSCLSSVSGSGISSVAPAFPGQSYNITSSFCPSTHKEDCGFLYLVVAILSLALLVIGWLLNVNISNSNY